MTIKEYLKEYLTQDKTIDNASTIEVWVAEVQGKGRITVEYDQVKDKVNIVHETHNKRSDFYEAVNAVELRDTVEYCLGPVVSDRQWNSNREQNIDFDLDDVDEF